MRLSLVVCLFAITAIVFAQSNTDDTSLFRGVENAIDENTEEDDAYRILKGLQEEEDSRENEEEEEEEDSRENEEEEEDDFSSNFPEFQNKETSEFFEHLPQPPTDNQNNEIKLEEHIEEQPNPFQNDQFIPWKRPETMTKSDTTFYQDINFRETTSTKPSLFKSWYIFVVFLVAIGLYYRQSHKSHASESTFWNNSEKDYLPLHNNSSKLL